MGTATSTDEKMSDRRGVVFDIKRFAVHDGPGIRTTVFLKGCPLSCLWCHNPESQRRQPEWMVYANRCLRCGACLDVCPQGAITLDETGLRTDEAACLLCGDCVEACYADARQLVGWEMSVGQVLAEIEKDVAFYDEAGGGVTFSGGEPLAQPDFLLALLQACRAREIHTVVDTCGYAPWAVLDRVRPFVNLFLYDLKVMDEDRHRRLTGVSNAPILANARALAERGHHLRLRLPVIPGLNDDEDNLRRLGRFAAALPHLEGVDLLPYHAIAADKYGRLHRPYDLDIQPPDEDRLAEIQQVLTAFHLPVRIGG